MANHPVKDSQLSCTSHHSPRIGKMINQTQNNGCSHPPNNVCDTQKLKDQIQMLWQKMLLLERSVWKMKKKVRIITQRAPPLEIPIRRRRRTVRQKTSNHEGIVGPYKVTESKRQMNAKRKQHLIKKFYDQYKHGATLATFSETHNVSQRTLRRWIRDDQVDVNT